MMKFIRQLTGGTWLKLKSCDKSCEYWVRPTNPNATIELKRDQIVKQERYSHQLIPNQRYSIS